MRLVVATGNPHKVEEIGAILGPDFELVAHEPGVDEDGETFEANALLKARAVRDATGEAAIADDSGIEVDSLGGRPGVHSARWTERGDWIPRLLHEVAGSDRRCRYVCAAALALPGGEEHVVRGVVEGVVADEPRGSGGFGYDPIMVPVEGDGRTFAQLSPAEKHALSHRGRAFRALLPALPRMLGPFRGQSPRKDPTLE
ncbi:MAG: RdgB/HAM1 family non-canonical purine NTP pyrophosphatase [Acidimicrobiales bacterium]